MGFDGFCFSSQVSRGADLVTGCTLTNWPERPAKEYIDRKLYERDPAMRHIWQNHTPFLWRVSALWRYTDDEFCDFLGSTPVKGGVVIPVYVAEDSYAILSLSRDCSRELDLQVMPAAIFFASALSLRFQSNTPPGDGHMEKIQRLSPRQRDILKWIVLGKSNMDIATICGLTKRNVDYHVGSILRIMDTTTRSQAAAIYASTCRDW